MAWRGRLRKTKGSMQRDAYGWIGTTGETDIAYEWA